MLLFPPLCLSSVHRMCMVTDLFLSITKKIILYLWLLFIPAADFDKPSVSYCNDEEILRPQSTWQILIENIHLFREEFKFVC